MLLFQSTIEAGIDGQRFLRNQELLDSCQPLREYVLYIERIRKYVVDMPIEQAVAQAVDECIAEGILADFLRQNKAEAIAMSIFEYDQEAHMKLVRQEGYDEGKSEGISIGKNAGKIEIVAGLVKDNLLSLDEALKRIDMPEEEFRKLL